MAEEVAGPALADPARDHPDGSRASSRSKHHGSGSAGDEAAWYDGSSVVGAVMETIETIEQAVKALSPEELAQFRAWFLEFDWAAWDRQLEKDVLAGKLDALAEKALRDHGAGRTRSV